MDSIRVGTVTGRRDAYIMDQHSHAVVKLEVELGTILNCYACDRHINTPIKPQCLSNKNAAIMLKDCRAMKYARHL